VKGAGEQGGGGVAGGDVEDERGEVSLERRGFGVWNGRR